MGITPRRTGLRRVGAMAAVFALASAMFIAASSATLSGSSFNSTNGSLTSNTQHDWNPAGSPSGNVGPVEAISCATGVNCGVDLVNDKSDNSLGQGSKEDDIAPTVVTGAIPPSKDDLSRFYVNKEKVSGTDYLYLAWERSNLLGSAHMDFEFNQSSTKSTNNVTPVRNAGDLLIDFDFSGSGDPVLAKHTWITSGNAATDCEASNTLPCWNKATNLTSGGFADGSVNSSDQLDYNPPNAPRTLPGNTKNGTNSTFGEAAINLQGAGVFSAGVCTHFGSAYLKSRSSGNSFSSELKDFIAPVPVNISNCGSLTIKKVTQPSPDTTDTSFSFSVNGPNPPNTSLPKTFSLKNGGTNTTTVFAGNSFSATETIPTNWQLVSATCSNGSGTANTTTGALTGITVAADEDVTCTFTNKLLQGAIKISKTSVKGNAALAGATFEIKSGTTVVATPVTGSDGTACVANLKFGDYSVKETAAPTGYNIDDTTSHTVTVNQNATCASGTTGQATIAFSDTPLSEIEVKFKSLAGAGVTASNIACSKSATNVAPVSENGNADPAFDDTDETFTNLAPGTYTCTVVVDP
jgi:Prealbumin-like fold domain